MFEYKLKKSVRRKTVAIKVHNQNVTVYAPHFVAKKQIDTWLFDKQEWVEEQLKKQFLIEDTKQYPFESREICVFSETIYLKLDSGQDSKVIPHDNHYSLQYLLELKITSQKYQQLLEDLFKRAAYCIYRNAFSVFLHSDE